MKRLAICRKCWDWQLWGHGRESIYANCDDLTNQVVIASNAHVGLGAYVPLCQARVSCRFKD